MATLGSNSSAALAADPAARLHPQARRLLDNLARQFAAAPQPAQPLTPTQQLETVRLGYRGVNQLSGQHDVFALENRTAAGVSVRLYRPSAQPDLPVVLYLHGGGFVAGDLETHDNLLRHLAREADALVVAVDYRRPPEHPFPAAPHDGLAVLRWLAEHAAEVGGDARRLRLAGDSAGGNLALVVALMARDQQLDLPVPALVLVYPDTELTESTPSWAQYGEFAPAILSRQNKVRNIALYAAGRPLADPYLSPLLADLRGLPPAFVLTAELDPQHDEGQQLAEKMSQAGGQVLYRDYAGMTHGFFQMAGVLDTGREAVRDVAAFLRAH